MWVSFWVPWVSYGGMCQDREALDTCIAMEEKCRKDKGRGLRYMRWLSYRRSNDRHHIQSIGVHGKVGKKAVNTHIWLGQSVKSSFNRSLLVDWCRGTAHPINGRPQSDVQVWPDRPRMVASFCYMGDMLSSGGGNCLKEVQGATTSLNSHYFSNKAHSHVYSSCVWSTLLHAS